MRIIFTLSLIALTAFLGTWLVKQELTAPDADSAEFATRKVGQSLYDEKLITSAYNIKLTNKSNIPHHFTFNKNNRWECITPYKDRADGRLHIGPLSEFTLGAEIVDVIPLKNIDLKSYGFEDDWVRVEFADKDNNALASYKIGIPSAWHKRYITKDERQQTVVTDIPTVFIIKENAPDDQVLYLVADPAFGIRKLFKNDFEGFRDHRPFALNRQAMEEVSIKRENSEIVIDHSTNTSPWRISKPLDLATDRKAVANLLTQLSALEAVKIHPSESISLPENKEGMVEVSIKNRYVEDKTTLTIYPSEEGAITSYATVSDRPGIVFELPNTPTANNKYSLAVLPKSINEIRARNMLTLNRNNIKTIAISPAYKPRLIIARKKLGKKYELYRANGTTARVNDFALSNLIASISVLPVKAFATDAATDLSQYDFQNPILEVTVLPFAGVPQRLIFSSKDGKIYAHRYQSRVVWEVAPKAYALIAKNEWDWRDTTLWTLLVNDVKTFTMQRPGSPKLTVQYDYIGDSFTGTLGDKNITEKINPIQAKYFLNNCHFLTANKRLGPNHAEARKALESPELTVSISSSKYDNDGLPTSEVDTKKITIAKPSLKLKKPPFYYAKVEGDEDYLIISPTTYYYLSTDIFADE